MSENEIKQKPSVGYNRDRDTTMHGLDEDGNPDTVTNREFSRYILDSICGGSEFGRPDEDVEWLRQMFDGFEDHIRDLRAERDAQAKSIHGERAIQEVEK